MELFIKYPIDVQNELLMRLIQFAKSTEFGELHHFSLNRSNQDFAAQVPSQQYESIEPLIDR